MEIRDLRYFLAVAQEQTISRAAEYLYIAQPSLSKQMKNLEKEIGQQLFVRGNRKTTLTDAGMLLRKRAEEMLDLYDKTQAELIAPLTDICGDIHIGGGESHSMQTIAKATKLTQNAFPKINFHFFSGDYADVTEKLDKGLIHFGVLVGKTDLSKYDSIQLPLCDTWGVLMRSDSPLAQKETISPSDLHGLPLILSKQTLDRGEILEWLKKPVAELNISATYNLIYNASLLVEEGMGYALCLDKLVNTSGSNLCFKPLCPKIESNLNIAWKKYSVFCKATESFLKHLQLAIEQNHGQRNMCQTTLKIEF